MKLMKTTEAVGRVLCHDITQIIPGVTKDAVFRKGHIITEEDIPVLLSVGKEHIYIWEKNENILHENEAAEILRDICMGEHMKPSEPKEGKIELTAEIDGLFLADTARLKAVNSLGRMIADAFTNRDQAKAIGEEMGRQAENLAESVASFSRVEIEVKGPAEARIARSPDHGDLDVLRSGLEANGIMWMD